MNRHQRRQQAALRRKDPPVRRTRFGYIPPPQVLPPESELEKVIPQFMALVTTLMAETGPSIRRNLVSAVDGEVSSQHMANAMLLHAVELEQAMTNREPREFLGAAVHILFLARDIAYNEGKLQTPEAAVDPS